MGADDGRRGMVTTEGMGAAEQGTLGGEAGPEIHWSSLVPREAAAHVVVVHGYGDHGGRYQELAEELFARGIATWRLDLRGHGHSGGARGDVLRHSDYLDDLERLLALARGRGAAPLFLLGHSHGGLVVLRHLLATQGAGVEGAILSAPYLQLAFEPPRWKLAAGEILRHVAPSLSIPSGIEPSMLTRDAERLAWTEADPLFFATTTPRWFHQVRRAQAEVRERGGELRLPLLVLLPLADPVVRAKATETFFGTVASSDKELIAFPEALHEIFNELPALRARAIDAVATWVLERVRVDRDRAPWQGG